jgi:hypothetical protein
VARADTHEHADSTGAHEVQRTLVRAASADDARDVEVAHERVEVERLVEARLVLGRDHRALDHEDVEPALQRGLDVALDVLRGELAAARTPPSLISLTRWVMSSGLTGSR